MQRRAPLSKLVSNFRAHFCDSLRQTFELRSVRIDYLVLGRGSLELFYLMHQMIKLTVGVASEICNVLIGTIRGGAALRSVRIRDAYMQLVNGLFEHVPAWG